MNLLIDSVDILSIGLAIAVGLLLGWFMNRNRNVDFSNIHVINQEDFTKNMRRGQLVDVRKKTEFEQDKIKGARNFTVAQMTSKHPKIRKDLSVYLYCNDGKKSKKVAKKLMRAEYKDVYILDGGFQKYNN